MGLIDFFTGKREPAPPPNFSRSAWDDYEQIIDSIVENPSIRTDMKRWFSEKVIMAKVKGKVIGRDHDTGVREALIEQTNILLSKLTKIDEKITLRIQDVIGAQTGHPTPSVPPLLDHEAQTELLSHLTALQGRMNTMKLFVDRQVACIPQRPAWQTWSKEFIGNIEIPMRDLEAAAHHLRNFLDRHS